MQYLNKVCLCCALMIVLHQAALADKGDKSDETSDVQERSEMADASPDSHEAMNNREINPITKPRQKRSYEFLMGLINNNSRYQVTRDEPTINLSKKQEELIPDVLQDSNRTSSSELLLELMVKIAANPDQWRRVHHLLQQIDQDIITSKKLIEDYQNHTRGIQAILNDENIQNDKPNISLQKLGDGKKIMKYTQAEINKEVAITSDNGQADVNAELLTSSTISTSHTKQWPIFPDEESKVKFVNTDISSTSLADDTKSTNVGSSSTTKAYPKYFSYHRVTGKPVFIKKNPTAYVAVSVVAPKSSDARFNEDLELEHELRQLKPWSHSQNLKNMESIRSRWVIDSQIDRKTAAKA